MRLEALQMRILSTGESMYGSVFLSDCGLLYRLVVSLYDAAPYI